MLGFTGRLSPWRSRRLPGLRWSLAIQLQLKLSLRARADACAARVSADAYAHCSAGARQRGLTLRRGGGRRSSPSFAVLAVVDAPRRRYLLWPRTRRSCAAASRAKPWLGRRASGRLLSAASSASQLAFGLGHRLCGGRHCAGGATIDYYIIHVSFTIRSEFELDNSAVGLGTG